MSKTASLLGREGVLIGLQKYDFLSTKAPSIPNRGGWGMSLLAGGEGFTIHILCSYFLFKFLKKHF